MKFTANMAIDPVAYEYVWTLNRPPLGDDMVKIFDHLPDVKEFELVKYEGNSPESDKEFSFED